MACKKILFCVIFINTYICDADIFTEFPEKCSIRDGECQKDTLSALLIGVAENGISELGIPALDPYKVKDTKISVLGMVDLTMTEGQVEGATNCTFIKFETNIDQRYTYTESFCDLIKISGRYKIEVGPFTQAIIGKPVSGDGFGKIQIEEMILQMRIPFNVEKHDDGEIYLVPRIKEAKYSTDVIENISFEADNVVLGSQEISGQLIGYMNSHWKTILRYFGRFFSDKVMETFYDYLEKFFVTFPASKLVIDDLSPYVNS